MLIHPIIQELLESGIEITVSYDKERRKNQYEISGFYKSDNVILIPESSTTLLAKARYNELTVINELRDIVQLNFNWYQSSKDRFSDWSSPDIRWIKLLKKFEFIIE